MLNIRPKSYNQTMRLFNCVSLSKYVPKLPNEYIEQIYNYVSQNANNRVTLTHEELSYINASGKVEMSANMTAFSTLFPFRKIIIGANTFNVLR